MDQPTLVEDVRHLLNHSAWSGFFVPLFSDLRSSYHTQLLDPSSDRKNAVPDDFLRGCIQTLDAILSVGPAFVEESDRASAQRQSDDNP